MSFFKGASTYLIANILNAAIPFALLPILTRYLTVSEYGQIAMFQVLLSGMGAFIGLNAVGAVNRKYYDDIDKSTLAIYNGSSIHILIISSIFTLIGIYIFRSELSFFLAIPISWIFSAVFISFTLFIIQLRLGQWQIRGQAKYYAILQILISLLNVLLSLILVIAIKEGATGRINAQVITMLIGAIISIFLLYRQNLLNLFKWRPDFIKDILHFGVPLIPHTVGFFLIGSVDRFVINLKLGLADAGIYLVAIQLSSVLAIIFDAINKAYVPWLFERLKHNNLLEKQKIVKNTYLYFCLLLVLAGLGFLIAPFFVTLIAGDKYQQAGSIIGLLCLAQIFGGMYLMVTNYLFYTKKTGKLASITLSTGIINFILLWFLVSKLGLTGAALSFAIVKLLQFLLVWWISAKYYSMPWLSYKSKSHLN